VKPMAIGQTPPDFLLLVFLTNDCLQKQILFHVHKPFILWTEHKFVKYGNTVIQHSIKQEVFPYQFIDASTPSATAVPHSHN